MPLRRGFSLLTSLALALGAMVPLTAPPRVHASSNVWINEIHYDNDGVDANEAIEIAGVAGTDLTGWSIVLYNGNGGNSYDSDALTGVIPDQEAGFGTAFVTYAVNGVQNGAPDGVALVDGTTVVQFLSYEGSFTAVGGPADGMVSTDIGIFEPSFSPIGDSLQLSGTGGSYGEFAWTSAHASFGQPNVDQAFASGLVTADCGDTVATRQGTPASKIVSATDVDGVVDSIAIETVEPAPATGSISVTDFSPAPSTGGTASATLALSADLAAGTYTVTVVADNADMPAQVGACSFSVTVFDSTEIAEIQGVGHLSPLDGEDVFDVEGVVTAVRTGRNGGFWMSDPTPDSDPLSSDGIFVFNRATPDVAVGDLVEVDGTVDEFRPFFEDLTITEIVNATWSIVSGGNALPTTTIGVDRMPPTVVIDDDSTTSVEADDAVYDPANDGIDFWETLEGMRLEVAGAVAVGPTNDFGEIAVVSRLQPAAGLFTPRGGLLVQDLALPGEEVGDYRSGDFNPERLLLDDLLAETPEVNVGDEFETNPVGVLDQSFGAFKLLVTEDAGRVDNQLTREAATPAGPHELAVATFNVENLSAVDCLNEPDKVTGLADQIVNNLRSPDLIAIEEMQDNSGDLDDEPDGDDGTVAADQSWKCLIDAIVDAGGPLYDYRQIDPDDNVDGGIPGGNIRVGFLFHSERGLEFVDRPGGTATNDVGVAPTANGKGAQLTFSPGRVLDASLGGSKAFLDTRKSLAGEFRFRGETVFVVANHFSSKGDDRPLYSKFQPPNRLTEFESGDPEDGWRHAQAQAVNDFVDEILAVDPNAHVIVLGDLNDFDFSETVQVLTGERIAAAGGPDPDGSGPTVPGGDAVMRSLFETLPATERYSYVFEGNSQVLDQILVSDSLIALGATYDVVHVNAEFADQVSDHDPSVMKIAFQPTPNELKPRGR